MMMHICWLRGHSSLLGLVTAICSVILWASSLPADDVTVFRNVRVFDGERVVPSTTVVVKNGVIEAVGSDIKPSDAAQVIDGKGQTLMPGLIDCHTHTFSVSQLEQAIVFGVTTELDMFTDHRLAAQMRSDQAAGKARNRADLLSAGTLVTAPRGHGTQFGLQIPTIANSDQAQEFVDARIAEGSDYIKIIYDDGKSVGISFPTISRETLGAVIEAVHTRHKLAVVHIGSREAARDAIELDADGLMHVFPDMAPDDTFIQLAAKKKVFMVPTLTVLESVGGIGSGAALAENPDLAPFLLPRDVRNLKSSFPRQESSRTDYAVARDAVRRLKEAGVPILAGSDAPNPGTGHGVSIHRELELLVAAGLSPTEALTGATSEPADRFRLSDRGRVAPKLRADLVLVDGDPTSDIIATQKVMGVWKQGQRVDRDAYRKRVEQQMEAVAKARNAPPPPGSESGLVSDFDGDKVEASFGSGWAVSTDVFVGGKSRAKFKLAEGGADGSKGSLWISGAIDDKPQPRWAGVTFSPGKSAFTPANLSTKKAISFWARGDGKSYSIMFFTQSGGFAPSMRSFVANKEWKQHRFKLDDFDGCDGSDIIGVFFGAGNETGAFDFQIDEVRFQ